MRKKKVLSCLLVPLLSANLLLSGCSRTADEPVTKSGFYFNTVISVSIYEKGSEELLKLSYRLFCISAAHKLHLIFSFCRWVHCFCIETVKTGYPHSGFPHCRDV